jgi:hypothetical protein
MSPETTPKSSFSLGSPISSLGRSDLGISEYTASTPASLNDSLLFGTAGTADTDISKSDGIRQRTGMEKRDSFVEGLEQGIEDARADQGGHADKAKGKGKERQTPSGSTTPGGSRFSARMKGMSSPLMEKLKLPGINMPDLSSVEVKSVAFPSLNRLVQLIDVDSPRSTFHLTDDSKRPR